MTTYIDVMRHGQPVGGRRYRGNKVDDALTEKGWAQMRAAIPKNPPWQHIVSSPLVRCLDFSKKLAEELHIDVSIVDDMKEIGFGDWEGKTPDEIIAQDSQALELFHQDPINNRPNGAEPLETFSQRVWNSYQNIVKTHAGEHVLIIAHAGVARAITANILNMSLSDVYSRLKIEYGAIICSAIDDGKPAKIIIHGPG